MSGNAHVRCEVGENLEIISKDYLSLLPKIESAEMMFSAARSRRLQIVPVIQSFAQLERNYGKESAEIIIDNVQLTLFGGFAPNSSSAEILSKSLGNRTVLTGSVSRGRNDPSQSLQMTERPLMTPDELKSLPKGTFIVMKTGFHPMQVKLRLFFEWGITFEKPYTVEEKGNRKVHYADKEEIIDGIMAKYHADDYQTEEIPPVAMPADVQPTEQPAAAENAGDTTSEKADKAKKTKASGEKNLKLEPTVSADEKDGEPNGEA